MKIRYLFLLMAFCFKASWADFSNMEAITHPSWPSTAHYLPSGVPYLIELKGEWPTDCHPGEQKPVITEYTGDSALIEFETIVEHVFCNDVVTPFRVLIDISDVFGSFEGAFGEIEITVRFGESDYKDTLSLSCPVCSPPPLPGPPTNPEAGLYYSDGMEKQGLLLARQNQRMGAFPLIYDESGSSEWLIGAGGIVEDVFFAELLESTGGQCLGCLPPDEPPQMEGVGKISMLMDSEGLVQVKINDGLFETYEPLVFGYGGVDIGGSPQISIPDLSGRWAFVDSDVLPYLGTPPPTSILPLVFDITLVSVFKPDLIVTIFPPGNATYSIRNIEGEEVAQMLCEYRTAMVCELDSPTNTDGFAVQLLSPERMILTSLSPIAMGRIGTGIAVRID
jgi:hypothetical protein